MAYLEWEFGQNRLVRSIILLHDISVPLVGRYLDHQVSVVKQW